MNMTLHRLPIFIGLVFALCVIIAFIPYLKKDKKPPALYHFSLPSNINRDTPLCLSLYSEDGIDPTDIEIVAVQGNTREKLEPLVTLPENGDMKLTSLQLTLSDSSKLTDGEIELEIKARSTGYRQRFGGLFTPFWTINRIKFSADITPPEISCNLTPKTVTQGGSALVLLHILHSNKALRSTLVEAAGHYCTVLELAPGHYAALIAFQTVLPPDDYKLKITASDTAGNTSITEGLAEVEEFSFRDDPIRLNDKFFQSKYQEFKEISGKDGDPVELFLFMNREVRASSYDFIRKLCMTDRQPEKLWGGAFLEMPNATRRSEFSDRRDYLHNGEVIDRQVHLGLDYTSITKDHIPAANDGVVIYAGLIGIHGQAVLIDHGLGLFSLYSHLSSIDVRHGQTVKRGEIIGRTGASGMAVGDHLHFEVLVNGVSVNPDQWFDAEWVRINIEEPLAAFTGEKND